MVLKSYFLATVEVQNLSRAWYYLKRHTGGLQMTFYHT